MPDFINAILNDIKDVEDLFLVVGLKGVNDFLFNIARAAERNYPDDPNTTLVKLRQFGEAMAVHLASLFGIDGAENQHELLKEFGKIKALFPLRVGANLYLQ